MFKISLYTIIIYLRPPKYKYQAECKWKSNSHHNTVILIQVLLYLLAKKTLDKLQNSLLAYLFFISLFSLSHVMQSYLFLNILLSFLQNNLEIP